MVLFLHFHVLRHSQLISCVRISFRPVAWTRRLFGNPYLGSYQRRVVYSTRLASTITAMPPTSIIFSCRQPIILLSLRLSQRDMRHAKYGSTSVSPNSSVMVRKKPSEPNPTQLLCGFLLLPWSVKPTNQVYMRSHLSQTSSSSLHIIQHHSIHPSIHPKTINLAVPPSRHITPERQAGTAIINTSNNNNNNNKGSDQYPLKIFHQIHVANRSQIESPLIGLLVRRNCLSLN
ncbi:hypothetical protein B0H66DRAFT_175576 [Apodospora peruviana]|uniref:Uncharacterized protein n=1 Tax=Apodospora peruviana TaxID=516989 RepID=A0AAE0M794_9PEZI|nr:hypothetical protein B0H66DRAFT_175576 [Apodospora peruviana]